MMTMSSLEALMKTYFRHFSRLMATAYSGLVLRICALLPCYLAYAKDLSLLLQGILVCLSVAIWGLIVMPFRVRSRVLLRRVLGRTVPETGYGMFFRRGLGRILRGLAYGWPFFLLAGLWYYGYHILNFKAFYTCLKNLGAFFGGRTDAGLFAFGGFMLLSILLYAFGWWRYTPIDYMAPDAAFTEGRRELVKNRRIYTLILLRNILMLLPSLALWAAVIIMYFRERITWSGSALSLLQDFSETMKSALPGTIILRLVFILVVVHVPLCTLRKFRYAEAVCALERDDQTAAG